MNKASKRNYGKESKDSKGQNQYLHARKRARERIKLDLTEHLYARMTTNLRDNISDEEMTVRYVAKQSKRVHMYSIKMKGYDEFNVIYDIDRNTVVTFLYPEEGQRIYHYVDLFGNNISVKHEYGTTWKIDNGTLHIPGEDVRKVADNEWEVDLAGMTKTFIFNGTLVEKCPFTSLRKASSSC